jgi:hypothetical protein
MPDEGFLMTKDKNAYVFYSYSIVFTSTSTLADPNLNLNPNSNLNLNPNLNHNLNLNPNINPNPFVVNLESGLVPSPSLLQRHSLTGVTSFEVYVSDVIGRRFEKVKNGHIFENWTSDLFENKRNKILYNIVRCKFEPMAEWVIYLY